MRATYLGILIVFSSVDEQPLQETNSVQEVLPRHVQREDALDNVFLHMRYLLDYFFHKWGRLAALKFNERAQNYVALFRPHFSRAFDSRVQAGAVPAVTLLHEYKLVERIFLVFQVGKRNRLSQKEALKQILSFGDLRSLNEDGDKV